MYSTDDSTPISMNHSTPILLAFTDDSTPILLTILLVNLLPFYSHSAPILVIVIPGDSTPTVLVSLLPFY